MMAALPPEDTTPLLSVLADPKTPIEHVRALKALSEEIKKNLDESRELTTRNETALRHAEEARAFSVSIAEQAQESTRKQAEEVKTHLFERTAELDDRAQNLTYREKTVDTREEALNARAAALTSAVQAFEDSKKTKEAKLAELLASAEQSRAAAVKLQAELTQKLNKLKEITG